MSRKQRFLFLSFLFIAALCRAQTFPGIQWKKCYGGSDLDYLMDIQQTFDGGYITVGFVYSNDGDVSNYHGNGDCWVVKLKQSGEIDWQKAIGGSSYDTGWSIKQTNDSGYIIGGNTASMGGEITNHGANDGWVIKLDKLGNIKWQRCYGGSDNDYFNSVIQTDHGEFIAAGSTNSNDGDVTGNHGSTDIWVIKIDSAGNLLWQKCLGGQLTDACNSAIETNDGGIAVAGLFMRYEITEFPSYNYIVKMDGMGSVEWEQTIYDKLMKERWQIVQTSDGGYILPGEYSTPVTSNSYYEDPHLLKLNADGSVAWGKKIETGGTGFIRSVIEAGNNGYLVSGSVTTGSNGIADTDSWVFELDAGRNIVWQKHMGGSDRDGTMKIIQTKDGNYLMANQAWSVDGDVDGNHGQLDQWIIKLGPVFSVDLSSFTLSRNCDNIRLLWQTNSETSAAYFEVQRSFNGSDFETIGSVPASGGAGTATTYQFTDNHPAGGRTLYRLKIVSTYETFQYSFLQPVNFAGQKSYLFPNPSSSVVTIVPKCNVLSIQLFAADGKLLRNLPVSNNDQYDFSNLPAGKYFLKLQYDNSREVLQLVKL